jgi:hypothetical protein
MSLSNSYVRTFVVSLIICVAGFLRFAQKYGVDWGSRRTALLFSIFGVAVIITTTLVGTFSSRAEKPWTWLKTLVISFGCWLTVLLLMALMTQAIYAR